MLDELENRINENSSKLDQLRDEIEKNFNRINENKEKIEHNSGALALLHTIKSNGDKYFVMWIITFMAFLFSIGYIVYLKNEYTQVETNTEEIQQENESGNNNYIGRDGDING
jgi:hypothetical protein